MTSVQQNNDPLDFLPLLDKSPSRKRSAAELAPLVAAETGEALILPPPAKRIHRVPFEWREDGRLDEIRKEMIGLLEKRLAEQNKGSSTKEKNALQAQVLEKLLFARCTSRESYLNCRENLDVKLRSVLAALLERRIRKSDQHVTRQQALTTVLGSAKKYNQVASLVSEIKSLRMGFPTKTTTSSATKPPASQDSSMKPSQQQPAMTSKDPVRDLYFRSDLVAAFELSPREDFEAMRWNNLISQAESIIQEYRAWIMKQKP